MEEGVGVMVDGVGVSGSLGRGDENIAAPVMVSGQGQGLRYGRGDHVGPRTYVDEGGSG